MHIYEFEILESDGFLVAVPFDFDGATQGRTMAELAEMAADWLKTTIEHHSMHGIALPEPTFGNEPRMGGTVALVAVEAGLKTVDAMSATDAARALGVTPGRVSQMLSCGLLEGFKDGRRSMVTRASVEARLAESPKPGRPRKEKAVTA